MLMIQEKYGDYQLTDYGPVRVKLPDLAVTYGDITAEMNRIAARHATHVDAEPHPIKADDIIKMNITTREGSSIFPGLTHEAVDVQLGVGALAEELETALLGHEVGEVVEAEYPYQDFSQVASDKETPADGGCGAGDTGEPEDLQLHSTVKILALRKYVVPEVTDEWVAQRIAGTDTVAGFRAMTERRLARQRQRNLANDIEYKVIEELGHRLVEDPPVDAVNHIQKQMLREFDRFLEQYELDRPAYMAIQGLSDTDFNEQVAQDAHDRIAQDIALASWATHHGVELNDDDINFLFGEPTPERTYEPRVEAEQTGQLDVFKDLALRAKVAEILTRDAIFVNPDGTENQDFKLAVNDKYEKLQRVREHATSDPMIAPPMVPLQS